MDALSLQDKPPVFNYILSFLLVGIAWGGTTPFIRRAAKSHKPPQHPILDDPSVKTSWLRSKLYGAFFSVVDLLRNPRYAVPLLLNLTGSVWFFLLIGQAGASSHTCYFLLLSPRHGWRADVAGINHWSCFTWENGYARRKPTNCLTIR